MCACVCVCCESSHQNSFFLSYLLQAPIILIAVFPFMHLTTTKSAHDQNGTWNHFKSDHWPIIITLCRNWSRLTSFCPVRSSDILLFKLNYDLYEIGYCGPLNGPNTKKNRTKNASVNPTIAGQPNGLSDINHYILLLWEILTLAETKFCSLLRVPKNVSFSHRF